MIAYFFFTNCQEETVGGKISSDQKRNMNTVFSQNQSKSEGAVSYLGIEIIYKPRL